MKKTMICIMLSVVSVLSLTSCFSKWDAEEDQKKAQTPKEQRYLNRDILSENSNLSRYYYSEWDSVKSSATSTQYVEYTVENCPRLFVSLANKFPYEICQGGTKVLVKDASRYYLAKKNGEAYQPYTLQAVEMQRWLEDKWFEDKTLYANSEIGGNYLKLDELSGVTWKYIGEGNYELTFHENASKSTLKYCFMLDRIIMGISGGKALYFTQHSL